VFDKVSTPLVDIFDKQTNEYYGRVIFDITPDNETVLLDMINNARAPKYLVLHHATVFPSSNRYIPPEYYRKQSRNGIIHAEFRDANSKLWTPANIYVSFDVETKGIQAGDVYHSENAEYSNIVINNIKILPQGGSPLNPETT